MEVRIGFCIMMGVAMSGMVYLWLEFSGFDSCRYVAVITSLCVSATFAAFTLLPGLPRNGTPGDHTDTTPGPAEVSQIR